MKPIRLIVALFIVFSLLVVSPAVYGVNLKLGTSLDDVSMKDMEGKDLQLKEFKGKVVLITFWSTWCNRCREELTFLNDNFANLEDLIIIAVNQDSDKAIYKNRVEAFVDGIGAESFKLAFDSGYELWDRFGINALPTSLIIDREGKVIHIEPNFYFASPDNFKRVIGKLLVAEGS